MKSLKLLKISALSMIYFILPILLNFTFLIPVVSSQKGINATPGQTLYTQFSLFYEKNCHQTTNYRKGIFLPVNSEVKFVKANKDRIVVALPAGEKLVVLNIKDYSGEEIDGIFNRTFAASPVILSPFSEEEKQAIMTGEVRKGMSKQAVLIALGYPPKHQTPSLELNQWRYWQNRFDTFVVHFENDRVTHIVD